MSFLRFSSLTLLALRATSVLAAEPSVQAWDSDEGSPEVSPNLAIKVSTTFPQSEIFGVKLVNGHLTEALVSFENEDTTGVNVAFVGGSLWGPDPATNGQTERIVRNLTSTRYNLQIPAGEKESITYSFATELHPQDLRLSIMAVLMSDAGGIYSLSAYNATVSIVEPDASIFDPQLIFLYLMLASLFAGSCYFIYTTWISTLFPQTATKPKGPKRSASKPDTSTQASAAAGGDAASATATGSKAYDESWIPEHHLKRPEAKRNKSSGKPKSPGGKGE